MKITCISASNIKKNGDNSTSGKICKIISNILVKNNITYRIIDLREYELAPCIE